MQELTSTRTPDAFTTLPPVCLFSEAPGHRSIFTGKERDAESGNDYFEARYYSSAMGRFMSPDWSAKEEPVPYAQLDDPQSLNLYAYVRNNPLTRTDLTGHCPQCALVLGTTEGGALIGSPGGPPGAAVGAVVGAVVGTVAAVAATYFGMKALSNWLHKDAPAPAPATETGTGNTNPHAGPVDKPVIVVDPHGNAIPVAAGQQIQGNKSGTYVQVKDKDGNPTGTRIDGGHKPSGHPDPRAQEPHAHVPDKTNADGTPWLPIKK